MNERDDESIETIDLEIEACDLDQLDSLTFKSKSIIVDELNKTEQKIKPGMKCGKLGDLLKKAIDKISEACNLGAFLRELNQFERKLKKNGQVLVVGNTLDAITHQFKEWRAKLS